ncbi:DNA recombination protein RmuC [Sphingomonas sp. AR_OL41]|uniref:DNA recombination protein RmuC n=1 Tax=Sphingomonas sp. AR_OL41 TaxID=3042729 RepID=UPI002481190D|nr:DNA recombination protein RmuC [Sphingomonas sp. AR_OL41]MDH7970880.1 DNA recombination protein RmuC [Sphingomonas sp. AR_OL41]
MDGMMTALVVVAVLVGGVLIGWLLGSRGTTQLRAERDARTEEFKRAIVDLAAAEERARGAELMREEAALLRDERDIARLENIELKTLASAFESRQKELLEAKEAMAGQFAELSAKALGQAQEVFLKRADERFRQSEETSGQNLKSMLQPVSDRLLRYEEAVGKVEAERKGAFSELKGQIEAMRVGQEKVSSEAAKLVNSLRNAPKSRGRWGEQQLKNVLETCGLSEHADFQTEVSVSDDEGGRLRPDAIIRVPGGRALVIDAKVSLNAYQDAFGAVDEAERVIGLAAHATAMRAHVNALGNKAYWSQFADAPDYVIMFVPGEHFLSAALEHDPTLWDFAFEKRVLLATPTNLIAIARTVSAVWRQEKLAKEARKIGELGKELYDRLAISAQHLRVMGSGLSSAVNNYNKFVGSFERNVLSSGRKFLGLNIEPGAREIEEVPPVEALARYGDVPKLIEDIGEAAE